MQKKIILILLLSCSVYYSQNKIKNNLLYDNMVKNGNYIEAIAGYDKIILLEPNNAIYLFKRGLAKLKSETDLDSAFKDFSKAILIKPKYSDAYWGRGMTNKLLKRYKEASIDLEKAIELNPNDFDSYISLAEVKYYLNDYIKSDFYYTKYLERNPNDYDTYSDRAYVKMQRLYFKEAIEDYNISIELNPKKRKEDFLERGRAKYLIKDYNGANSDFNLAIEIDSASVKTLSSIANFYNEKENFKDAKKHLDKILIIDPNNIQAYLNRGFSNNGLQKYDEAILDLNKYIAVDPDFGYSYILRGYAKTKLGLLDDSCLDFNKAKALGEKDSDEYIEDYCE